MNMSSIKGENSRSDPEVIKCLSATLTQSATAITHANGDMSRNTLVVSEIPKDSERLGEPMLEILALLLLRAELGYDTVDGLLCVRGHHGRLERLELIVRD